MFCLKATPCSNYQSFLPILSVIEFGYVFVCGCVEYVVTKAPCVIIQFQSLRPREIGA